MYLARLKSFFKCKELVIVLLIMLVSFFFYTYRLEDTQLFINDTARDTYFSLKLWLNKEITLIGSPAYFATHSVKDLFFGSAYLYIAIIGLITTQFNPIGAVIPNTILFTFSIPLFYYFSKYFFNDSFKRIFSTMLFAFSPLTVTHARFFWNPNIIIPLSVFFWYFILNKSNKSLFISGLIAGLIVNLHYINGIPIILYFVFFLFTNKFQRTIYILSGFLLGLSPLILFELRNHFYLTQALIVNLQNATIGSAKSISYFIDKFFTILWTVLGLKHSEIPFPIILKISKLQFYIFNIGFLYIFFKNFVSKLHSKRDNTLWLTVLLFIVIGIYLSSNILYFRYFFSIYPLIIILFVKCIPISRWKYLFLLFFIPILFSSFLVSQQKVNFKTNYLSLRTIEKISNAIISDKPTGNYNVSEFLRGDTRATAFRYFLVKNARVKPQDEKQYANLSTLYVISPTLQKIFKENRWEFTASGKYKLVKTTDFGEVKLYKFVK